MGGCVFCDIDLHKGKVVYESDNFYAIPTIGQISDGGHTLLITKAHTSCLGAMEPTLFDEFVEGKTKLEQAIEAEYGSLMQFEHGIIGQSVYHAHLQMLPSATDIFQALKRDYPFSEELEDIRDLMRVYNDRRVYMFYENQQHEKHVFVLDAIPQYLRLVAAQHMGRTPRGDWKAWRSDSVCAKKDDEFIDETVKKLKRIL